LPALLLRNAVFERGHWSSSGSDLIKNFPVRHAVHPYNVGEVGGRGRVRSGFWSVTLARNAMALRALVAVDLSGGFQIGIGGLQRVFQAFVFGRDHPGSVLVENGIADDDANDEEQKNEESLPGGKIRLWSSVHSDEEFSHNGERNGVSERHRNDQLGRKMSQSSSPLKKRIAAATIQAMT